jgi:CubicO group peptidase (beta-lactamase class C family)
MKQSDVVQAFRPATDVKVRTTFNMVQGFGLAICVALLPAALLGKSAPVVDTKVDAVFAKYSASTPGCAVGVATGGTPVLAKGFGMADLERDVRISADTIFEAGSVSKQFTAAAVMLLAREGKLSLDDQVRKYVPELPDYPPPPDVEAPGYGEASPKPHAAKAGGSSLTIRHMLNHTSGLRDWGSVAAIGGAPRGSRAYTHAHVLDIVSRQKALNFPPGTRWSYSNTGFNLAAIIVERVGGVSFQEFTRTRLFQPAGMTHTSWRDDFTRIVKGRAQAYDERDGSYRIDMPFENVYGNGGLLTTVGDLLKWNQHYDAPPAGDAAMIAEQQTPGRFNDGRPHGYGLGLFIGTYKGLHEVSHSGSTGGYSAFLTRFPDQHVSVAVLCNASSAPATEYAHQVADLYLGDRLKPSGAKATHTLTSAELDAFAGLWKDDTTGLPFTIVREQDGLVIFRTVKLFASSPTRVVTEEGRDELRLDGHGLRHTDPYGTVESLTRTKPAQYTDEQLSAFVGTYASDDAETVLTAAIENHALVLKRRPATTIKLTPIYPDTFTAGSGLGTVIFRRNANGGPSELDVVQDRVWNMRFRRN